MLDWPAAVLTCPQQRMLENFDMKLSGICCRPEIMSVFNKLDEANETKHEVSLVHAVIRNVTMSIFIVWSSQILFKAFNGANRHGCTLC